MAGIAILFDQELPAYLPLLNELIELAGFDKVEK